MGTKIVIRDVGGSDAYSGKSRFRAIVVGRRDEEACHQAITAPCRTSRAATLTRREILSECERGNVVFVIDPGSRGQNRDDDGRPITDYTWWSVEAERG